ncbi:hypothetical protein ACN4EK_15165 [Pantanalinema rosaneae CENA516]|uniref:hypothetical protein n=1 Tax=Pantanalinema rosaneae TaxID=1620701 RepID=UPI003D701A26
MYRILFSLPLAFTFGVLFLSQSNPAIADSFVSTTTAYQVAQEPNQDSLQMNCNGSIPANDMNYTAFFTREAGFSRIVFRRRSNNQQIAETFLSFDRQNNKGQAIWRGSVNNAATVTLIHLASRPAQPGDQVSVGYDKQWGRGTCR